MRTISIAQDDLTRLQSLLFTPDRNENAVFALCGYATREGEDRLFVRRLVEVPGDGYAVRSPFHLEVRPRFINHVVDLATGRMAILTIHSHPGGLIDQYSTSDDFGEERLLGVLSDLIPSAPHSSLLFSDSGVIGRYWVRDHFEPIDAFRIAGPTLQPTPRGTTGTRGPGGRSPGRERARTFHRQVIAFGQETQKRISGTRVAVVGCGGTGSCIAEQLVRMGVGDIVLVDPDRFEESNLTRLFGSVHADVPLKPLKTDIVERNLRSINPSIRVSKEPVSVVSQRAVMRLLDCDMVFSCTDNESSRAVLNRFAYQYFVPVIDVGTRIVVADNHIIGAAGRVTLIGPSLPCLWCGYHLDASRIRVETIEPKERQKLERQGYIEGVDEPTPAVVSLNSTLASLAVTMFVGAITPFGRIPQESAEQIYDAVDGTVFRSSPVSNPACHVCGLKGVLGLGDLARVTTFP